MKHALRGRRLTGGGAVLVSARDDSGTNDRSLGGPRFPRTGRVSAVRFHVSDALRDDDRLTPAEADRATTGDLAGRATRTDPPGVPGTAVADAYARWAATADPATVAEREADRRINGIDADIPDAGASPGPGEPGSGPGSTMPAEPDAGGFRYTTAYLDGAAAVVAELAGGGQADPTGADDTAAGRPGSAAADLAAAEAAITLYRENRDRHGYTDDDAVTARALRAVLDAAQVWEHLTAPAPVDRPWVLADELAPDRVRPRPGWDDAVVLDAGFGGATITVHRTGHTGAPAGYEFLATGPGGRGPLRDVDSTGMGVIDLVVTLSSPTKTAVSFVVS